MDAKDKKYDYNKFGKKGKRVGQAVTDILAQDNPIYTVEDILHEYSPDFVKEFESTIEKNKQQYDGRFYVLVLTGKEMWATNVVRNWFIARKTPPYATDMVADYPHRTKTLYLIDSNIGKVEVLWSIPGIEECKSILASPAMYDRTLINWICDCFQGFLNKEDYSFSPPKSNKLFYN